GVDGVQIEAGSNVLGYGMPVSGGQHDPADPETPQARKQIWRAGTQGVGHDDVTGQLAIDCHRDESRARAEDSPLGVNGTDALGDEAHPIRHYAATSDQASETF